MKKILSIFFLFGFQLVFFQLNAQVPVWQWEKKMGGFYSDGANSIAIDKKGNIYTTGGEGGSADFDPGPVDYYLSPFESNIENIFISKLDSAGNFLWAKSIGTSQVFTEGNGIAVDASGNVYVAGEFADTIDFDPDSVSTYNMIPNGISDIFILKLDSSGNFIWARHLGGKDIDAPDAIAIDGAGNVYTTGYFRDTADFDPDSSSVYNMISAGYHDVFISKLDSAGNFIWAKQLGGTNGEEGKSIAIDAAGNVYTTGWFYGTTDFDPGAGTVNLTTNGVEDIFISKLDSAGNFVWAKAVGGTGQDIAQGITTDAFGNVYTTGGFYDTVDFDPGSGIYNLATRGFYGDVFILKLNSNGEFIWAREMGGDYSDWGESVAVSKEGNVYSTGWFISIADFDPDTSSTFLLVDSSTNWVDIYVSALDSSGNFIWAKSTIGSAGDQGMSLVCDSSENIFITGAFGSPILMFDSVPLANTGGGSGDVWVGKLSNAVNTSVVDIAPEYPFISVFPNPATSKIIFNSNSFKGPTEIRILNILGELELAVQTKANYQESEMSIDISALQNGIYQLEINNAGQLMRSKFIKE